MEVLFLSFMFRIKINLLGKNLYIYILLELISLLMVKCIDGIIFAWQKKTWSMFL